MVSKSFPKCIKIRTNPKIFSCTICDYNCCRKSDMKNHINSKKHTLKVISIKRINSVTSKFACQYCNKPYKTNSGLWKHEKKCQVSCARYFSKHISKKSVQSVTEEKESKKDDMLMECMKMMKKLARLSLAIIPFRCPKVI